MRLAMRGAVLAAVTAVLALAAAGTAGAEGAEVARVPCTIGTPDGFIHGEAVNVIAPSGAAAHVCVVHDSTVTEEFPLPSCTIGAGGDTVQATRFRLVATPNGTVVLICTHSPNG